MWKYFIVLSIFIEGCATTYPTGPDRAVSVNRLATPVSLTSVVSINKKKETNEIKKISGYASYAQVTDTYSNVTKTSSSHMNDIEKTIFDNTEGDKNKAVKDVKITLLINSYPADLDGSTTGSIEGKLINVK